MLIFVSPLLNPNGLLLPSIKLMLKRKRSFRESVLNEKDRCSLLSVCFGSSKLTFTHKDFPFI